MDKVTGGIAVVFFSFIGMAVVIHCLPNQSRTPISDIIHILGGLAPLITFSSVFVAVIGWGSAARAAGNEARRTEQEKRGALNKAHRGLLRARFFRVFGIIDEAVGVKPYQPDIIEKFIMEAEAAYWEVDTFGAFTTEEQAILENTINRVRLDNYIAQKMLSELAEEVHYDDRFRPRPHEIIRESFLTSLGQFAYMFRDVFKDQSFVDKVKRRYDQTVDFLQAVHSDKENMYFHLDLSLESG